MTAAPMGKSHAPTASCLCCSTVSAASKVTGSQPGEPPSLPAPEPRQGLSNPEHKPSAQGSGRPSEQGSLGLSPLSLREERSQGNLVQGPTLRAGCWLRPGDLVPGSLSPGV